MSLTLLSATSLNKMEKKMPTPVFSSFNTNQKQQPHAQVVDKLTFTHVQTRGKDKLTDSQMEAK